VSGWIVAATSDGKLEVMVLGECQSHRDVPGVNAPCDCRRLPVDQQVETVTRPVIVAVGGLYHISRKRIAELDESSGD